MPRTRPPYPQEFREQIIALARSGRSVRELSEEFEPSGETIRNWIKQADLDEGVRSDGLTTEERKEIKRLRRELVLAALEMALQHRRPEEVIHHSDRGSQYTSIAFGKRCSRAGVRPSMGETCYDNALCESFFATLECELIDRESFATRGEARMAVFSFIESWYNPKRQHSALDYLSPIEFENHYLIINQAT